jgi:hypothetical protein
MKDTRPKVVNFQVGDIVRVREEYRQPDDFETADVYNVDDDGTVDVSVNGEDWGQWFCRLPDGTYEIELVPRVNQHPR